MGPWVGAMFLVRDAWTAFVPDTACSGGRAMLYGEDSGVSVFCQHFNGIAA